MAIFMFTVTSIFSQGLDSAGVISREKSTAVIKKLFNNDSSNYLLFSISDRWYLIIRDCGSHYVEYYVNTMPFKSSGLSTKILKLNKPNKILNDAFNSKQYHTGYITFGSPFFKDRELYSEGNITYFFLSKHGQMFGESRLSVFINPNPIDDKIYNYLKMRALRFVQE